MIDLKDDFPQLETLHLRDNYRSTGSICRAADSLMAKAPGSDNRLPLKAVKGVGMQVSYMEYDSQDDKSNGVLEQILQLEEEGMPLGEMAVCCHTNQQAEYYQSRLLCAGVPHRLLSGRNFWKRKEVKDIMAYMRLVANPGDNVALRRVINIPARKIGPRTVETLSVRASEKNCRLAEMLFGDMVGANPLQSCEPPPFPPAEEMGHGARKGLTAIRQIIWNGRRTACKPGSSFSDVLQTVLSESGYEAHVKGDKCGAEKDTGNDHDLRWSYVMKLPDALMEIQNNMPNGDVSSEPSTEKQSSPSTLDALRYCGGNVALMTDNKADIQNSDSGRGRVNVTTFHGAKGLEFNGVFLIGCQEGILPWKNGNMEEERRLFYVGITRAKERLFISWVGNRSIFLAGMLPDDDGVREAVGQRRVCQATSYAQQPEPVLDAANNFSAFGGSYAEQVTSGNSSRKKYIPQRGREPSSSPEGAQVMGGNRICDGPAGKLPASQGGCLPHQASSAGTTISIQAGCSSEAGPSVRSAPDAAYPEAAVGPLWAALCDKFCACNGPDFVATSCCAFGNLASSSTPSTSTSTNIRTATYASATAASPSQSALPFPPSSSNSGTPSLTNTSLASVSPALYLLLLLLPQPIGGQVSHAGTVPGFPPPPPARRSKPHGPSQPEHKQQQQRKLHRGGRIPEEMQKGAWKPPKDTKELPGIHAIDSTPASDPPTSEEEEARGRWATYRQRMSTETSAVCGCPWDNPNLMLDLVDVIYLLLDAKGRLAMCRSRISPLCARQRTEFCSIDWAEVVKYARYLCLRRADSVLAVRVLRIITTYIDPAVVSTNVFLSGNERNWKSKNPAQNPDRPILEGHGTFTCWAPCVLLNNVVYYLNTYS
mmetsp:Transcript_9570/g.27386  ORF Transcript_9570/g.27386 Transcript_9570/m.27386 type:complete len:879 (+) Transcript_9570:173-2809(+)